MNNSEKIFENLCQVIPGGVNSPVRAFTGLKLPPMVVRSGQRDCVTDENGQSFIDFCCSWGALIHGHADPEILGPVQKRMEMGTSFGITTEIEGRLAKKIIDCIESIDRVRFVSSGTEATMTAVRIARGYTGRDMVIKFAGNYHGHADFFLVQAGSGALTHLSASSSAGIPQDTIKNMICLPYNDNKACLDIFEKFKDRIAAVIVEPITANMGVVPGEVSFLRMLREETERIGALLIFDEVITGFRLGLGGAQSYFSIQPDLTCLGKIIGGGFPAAAFGGRKEVMECLAPLGPVYQAGTLSGNPVAMEAGLQTLALLEKEGVYEELERKTDVITQPVKEFIEKKSLNACVQQAGSLFTLFFGKREVKNLNDARELDLETFARFFRFMYENGVYLSPSQHEAWFISLAHKEEHMEKTRDLILSFLAG